MDNQSPQDNNNNMHQQLNNKEENKLVNTFSESKFSNEV